MLLLISDLTQGTPVLMNHVFPQHSTPSKTVQFTEVVDMSS